MKRNPLAAFGLLTLLVSPLTLPVRFVRESTKNPMFLPPSRVLLLAIMLVAFGLIFRRKWAALYFSLPLCAYGVYEAFTSIEQVTFPLNLLVMLHGISLTLPLVITIRVWKDLTWGRRFF
jgi:hypothetical protein